MKNITIEDIKEANERLQDYMIRHHSCIIQQIEDLIETNKRLQSYIDQSKRECLEACNDIIREKCKHAIDRMNKKLDPELAGHDDAIGEGFNFFETLSVSFHHFGYSLEEINPYLDDYIDDMLQDECDHLSSSELFVLEYGEYIVENGYRDLCGAMRDMFFGLLDDTYSSDKVQEHCMYL